MLGATYYRKNKRKFAILFFPVLLSVMLLYSVHTVINSYLETDYNAFVETRKYYTSIQAKGNLIDDNLLQAIEQYEYTEDIFPCILSYTQIDTIFSPVGIRIYSLHHNKIDSLMDRMKLTIKTGRLPRAGEQEIAIHQTIAINKQLNVGEWIGNEINSNEKLLGKYKIVGILEGKALAGIVSLEYLEQRNNFKNPKNYGVMIFAKEGQREALNKYISYLPVYGIEISSYDNSLSTHNKYRSRVKIILNVIYLSVLLITSICLGFLTYLFYIRRIKEYAIMHVVGFSKQYIILNNIKELVVINSLSVILGSVLGMMIAWILNITLFNQMGSQLQCFNWKSIGLVLCVPIMTIVAQLICIIVPFNEVDLIGILEAKHGGVV